VIRKALDKGLITQTEAAHIAPHEVVKLVLMPGFSTAAEVSDISGRGVGMDVVRTNVEKLGGSVELETEEGMGTTVTLRLPLTLAIIPSLIVGASDARFAVPQVGIDELVWVRSDDVQSKIETIQNVPVLRLRGRLLPLVRLTDVLEIEREFVDPGTGEAQPDRRQSIADQRVADGESRKVEANRRQSASGDFNILVLRAGGNRFGLVVDELFESEEIVLKPLPSYVKQISCFAGTTILGDGRVTMILDPGGLATLAKLSFVSVAREETRRQAEAERADSGTSERSVILFDSAPGEVFAVPQDRVLRLERIERKQVEVLGGQEFVKYRGAGLPVIRLDTHFPVTPVPSDSEEMFLIIPKDVQASQPTAARAGILAHRIVDARDVSVQLHRPLFEGPGMKGSAIVDGNLTMFLDPVELVREMGYAEPGGV
jgi:two-component system chemotaxis sensor kinase CheA